MTEDLLVKVEGVSKKFCRSLKRSLWYGVQDVSAEMFGLKGSNEQLRKNEFWAVNDVSFELRRGECLGLIGPNGAGKSTLLKMLNGLVKPDIGRICMRGRVGALIELGAGFNPILSARENIYVNGSVLGFSKKEIDLKFDAIVDFAELEEFIDSPVQNFSTGMKVRLGFAVASQMEPDVLLIDEVLAVGDAGFVAKCLNKISNLSRSASIVFVSHTMALISRMASRVMLIEDGGQSWTGSDVSVGIQQYLKTFEIMNPVVTEFGFRLLKVELLSSKSSDPIEDNTIPFGQSLRANFYFRANRQVPKFCVNVAFNDLAGEMVAQCFSLNDGFEVRHHSDKFCITLELDRLQLNAGKYAIQIILVEGLENQRRGQVLYKNTQSETLQVTNAVIGWAPVQFYAKWSCKSFEC